MNTFPSFNCGKNNSQKNFIRDRVMSKMTELNTTVAELNKKVEELQEVFNVYKRLLADVSQNMYGSLSILLDNIQSLIEMVYLKDSNPGSLEKISTAILDEINKLIALKTKLCSLSGIEMKTVTKDLQV